MEQQPAAALFRKPHHPYTAALLEALPERSAGKRRLAAIPGVVPGLGDRPQGCLFHPRCAYAVEACMSARPPLVRDGAAAVRCIKPLNAVLEPA